MAGHAPAGGCLFLEPGWKGDNMACRWDFLLGRGRGRTAKVQQLWSGVKARDEMGRVGTWKGGMGRKQTRAVECEREAGEREKGKGRLRGGRSEKSQG